METTFTYGFSRFDGVGDSITTQLADGSIARATIVNDDDSGPSWENGDGYGIVSDWRDLDSKRPGERVLCTDHGSVRFYDVQATMQKAREEDWGCGIDAHDHTTRREQAACAVEQDFRFHQAWCEDRWSYVGVTLEIIGPDGEDIDAFAGSLWGIECGYDTATYNSSEYLTSVAHDLLAEYEHGLEREATAKRQVQTLIAYGVTAGKERRDAFLSHDSGTPCRLTDHNCPGSRLVYSTGATIS